MSTAHNADRPCPRPTLHGKAGILWALNLGSHRKHVAGQIVPSKNLTVRQAGRPLQYAAVVVNGGFFCVVLPKQGVSRLCVHVAVSSSPQSGAWHASSSPWSAASELATC